MNDPIIWTQEDMIAAACEHFGEGFEPADCRIIGALDGHSGNCLVVLHEPTGRTSDESGDGGRWREDGAAY